MSYLLLPNGDRLLLPGGDGLLLPASGGGATVPDAVDDLAAAPGVEKLTFTWTAPANGGAAISFYSLYLNGVEYESEVTSPHEVTGLTGGVASGPWTVTATNSEGESDPSNAVTETPTAPPAATGRRRNRRRLTGG